MVNDILYRQEAREKILSGIHLVSKTVKTTLGPKGREALILQDSGLPLIVKDGFEIIRSVKLKDSYENMGAQVIKEAAAAMNDAVGDGTATTVILADSILREGLKNIAAGANPIELRKGIQGAVQLSCAAIKKMSRPAESTEDLLHVSTVSAGSELAGELVSQAMEQIGPEGVISVEETPNTETTLEFTRGMQYEKGYLNAQMLKDPGSTGEELEQPYILVTDHEISNAQELIPLLEQVHSEARSLLIIAEKITDGALTTLILNKRQGIMNVMAVHPPAYGDGRRAQMEDICLFTGGAFVTAQLGRSLRDVKTEMLGTAEKVIVSKNTTAIIGGKGKTADIQAHLAGLRRFIQTEDYGFKKERYQERLAKFTGGTARIKVGAPAEPEMKELKHRLENAVQAAKAAAAEGIVPGGGTTYVDILPAVRAYTASLNGDRKTGASIVLKALEAPLRQIAENAGKNPSVVIDKVKNSKRGFGYDVLKDAYTNMMESGVIDSERVVRLALQCAASAASTLLTVEAGISVKAENPEK